MPAVYDSLRILDSSSLATSQASYLHVYWSSKEWCFSSCLVCLSLLIFSEVKVLYSSFYFPLLWYLLYSTLLHSKIGSMVKSMCLLFQKLPGLYSQYSIVLTTMWLLDYNFLLSPVSGSLHPSSDLCGHQAYTCTTYM